MMVSTMLKAVSLGEKVWDRFDSVKTGILYLDLEQDEEAAGERWEKIRDGHQLDNCRVFFTWPRMHKGGLDHIRNFLLKNADVGLVVIDTWAMFNPAGPSEDSEKLNAYYQEYDVLGQLKSLANEFSIALVIVHHFSVNRDRPSGTAAMEGSPDGDWRLHREEGSKIAVLNVKGKNTPETKISFDVDLRVMRWNVTSVE
jgi:RecA-family ATPase